MQLTKIIMVLGLAVSVSQAMAEAGQMYSRMSRPEGVNTPVGLFATNTDKEVQVSPINVKDTSLQDDHIVQDFYIARPSSYSSKDKLPSIQKALNDYATGGNVENKRIEIEITNKADSEVLPILMGRSLQNYQGTLRLNVQSDKIWGQSFNSTNSQFRRIFAAVPNANVTIHVIGKTDPTTFKQMFEAATDNHKQAKRVVNFSFDPSVDKSSINNVIKQSRSLSGISFDSITAAGLGPDIIKQGLEKGLIIGDKLDLTR